MCFSPGMERPSGVRIKIDATLSTNILDATVSLRRDAIVAALPNGGDQGRQERPRIIHRDHVEKLVVFQGRIVELEQRHSDREFGIILELLAIIGRFVTSPFLMILPRTAPLLMNATSVPALTRVASATKAPEFVSPVRSGVARASTSTPKQPIVTPNSASACSSQSTILACMSMLKGSASVSDSMRPSTDSTLPSSLNHMVMTHCVARSAAPFAIGALPHTEVNVVE